MPQFSATVFLFSGRRDPDWKVSHEMLAELEAIWDKLKPFEGAKPSPRPLGYKGCAIRQDKDIEYFAYGGVVTRTEKNTAEVRKDANKSIEKLILASAPKKLLPTQLINSFFNRED